MDRADTKELGKYRGGLYQDAVRRCLTRGKSPGLEKNADETDAGAGAARHGLHFTEVVRKKSEI